MMLAAITAFGMASCEDVPAPFIEPIVPEAGGSENITLPYTSANLKDGFEVHTTTGMAWSLGNTYAKATGYNSGSTTASETYLISPAINLGDAEKVYLDFDYVIAYNNSLGLEEGHQVMVCTEYDNLDPTKSNWVKLPFAPKERENTSSWDMYAANSMSIPAEFMGKSIRIAFLYKCNSSSASTWELTNLKVSTEPNGEVTPDNPDTPADGGTWDKPYTVAQAIADQSGKEVWVRGYIVGSIPADASSTVMENMTFTADGANHTNLCIADSPTETNYVNCAPVQLPSGSDARTNLNLKENPSMLGKEVWLKGKATKYCGAPGLKEISKYTLTAPTAEDDEENGNTPAEGAKGDGSLENPFNAAGAYNYAASLSADQETNEKFYIKGIVCESSKFDINTQYKNATFHISEDGTSNGTQFLIFRTKGLNGADITSEDDVKVGDEVVIYAQLVNYMGNTPETSQGGIIYSQKRNGQDMGNGDDNDTPSDAQGDGSLENPYNLAAIWALYENGSPEGTSVHVKGIISQVKSLDVSRWERAQYFISDDGTENGQFQIYNGYYLNGQPFTANDQIKVGDEVIVYGELSSYNGTPQIGQNSKIVSINGQTEGGETPEEGGAGDGTKENPWSIAEVITMFETDSYDKENEHYIKGIITEVDSYNSKYGSISYYVSDAGASNKFYIYSGLGLNKNKFSSQKDLHVGDEVVVCGKFTVYNGKPQFNYNNYLVSHKSNSSDNDDDQEEETESNDSFFKASDLGLENGAAFTSVSVYGVTLSVTAGGNNNSPKYYDNGSNLRMYPKNTLTISTEKVISSIKLNCASEYVASGDVSADKGTIKVEDPIITISNINDKSFTLTNTSATTGAASQIRIESFEITYAE